MRSIGKYELLEPITTGSVEVFVAEEKGTGLRRLVYLGASKDDMPQPSTRDILQRFRSLAPDPPGVILDAGTDPLTRSIYLVTSFPSDPLAIQTWMQAYRVFSEKDKKPGVLLATGLAGLGEGAQLVPTEIVAPAALGRISAAPPSPHASRPLAEQETGENSRTGEFTRMFQQMGPADAKTTSASKHSQATHIGEPSVTPTLPTQGYDRPKPPSAPTASSTAQQGPNGPAPGPGAFTREFFGSPSPTEQAPEPASETKAGEFTQFFRGGGAAPPEQSSPRADIFPEPARDQGPGEFTRMFNSSQPPAPSSGAPELRFSSSPNTDPLPSQSPGTFTRLTKSPSADEPHGGQFLAPKFDSTNPGQTYSLEPRSGRGAPTNSVLRPMWDRDEEPSRVFTPPPEPVASQPVAAAGPSEFTQIISRPRSAPPPAPNLSPTAPSPVGTPATFPAMTPPTITPPAVAMPQIPVAPPAPLPPPAFQAPAPQIPAMPQAPAPAPAVATAARPVSYLPLIIILNVVLIAGVALVLYFALKPH